MIRRLRLRAPVYASALLLLIGMALTAAGTEAITRSQAEAMIDARLAAAGVLVCGAFWILLLTISERSEKALTASILRLETAVGNFTRALEAHDANPNAHTAASEHNHNPMNAALRRVEEALADISMNVASLVDGQKGALEELGEQDERIGIIEKSLQTLLAEHHILHGRALMHRADDPPTINLDVLRKP